MKREEVRKRIAAIGIVPGIRLSREEDALYAAETLYNAGIPVAEITMTVPGAVGIIGNLRERFPDMVVGAGTVLDAETAERCADVGACFITSTGLVHEVVETALLRDIAVFPGALTPTEVIAAWKTGADFVKIFPAAPVGGDQYIRSLRVPLPQVRFIATGGVTQLTATSFIRAGAAAVGIGVELMPKDAVRLRQDQRIHELARRFLGFVAEGRAVPE
ncbi:bifunctional 4-hydroxy-2-oxoglutarate aldolase/2-dehydro-3-deoxy-phosphogluconate aldolase [Acidobacteria bacterium AB60]|nr:bifunctional 4-hydroxy-2-oxoglutarate aldolase/2-dehydro-3-deoxy-phosphogluconate aldolase [Acidobacteria bacterium AB60]